jgi:diacylglycerol kinase (ATP)
MPDTAESGPPLHCLVIANPAAGQAAAFPAEEVVRLCLEHGAASARAVATEHPGHATELARAEAERCAPGEPRMVVAVGGDGTAYEAALGLLAAGRAAGGACGCGLLPVPAGTGNSNYRSLWDPAPWRAALGQAVAEPAAHLLRLDLARHVQSDRPVLLGAGAGLTAQVLEDARAVPADVVGPARLQAGLARTLAGFRPYPGRVTVDGAVVHEGPTLFANVGGGRFRAWQFEVLPDSVLDDGLLEVCVVGAGVGADFGAVGEAMRRGAHLDLPDVVAAAGRVVVLERLDGEPLCFEHDGAVLPGAGSRATLRVEPRALPVYCSPQAVHARTVPLTYLELSR